MSSNKENREITPSNFSEGPLKEIDRGCTDILCCLIFTVCFVAMFVVAIYSFSTGKPEYVLAPMDPDGNFCGLSPTSKDYKYIYFVAPGPNTLYRTVCVKECPTEKDTKLDCLVNKEVKSCEGIKITAAATTPSTLFGTNEKFREINEKKKKFEASPNFNIRKDLMDIAMFKDGKEEIVSLDGLSASIIFESQSAIYPSKKLGNVCLPQLKEYLEQVKKSMNLAGSDEIMDDLKKTWGISLACAFIALVLGFIFMILTRYGAKLIVWSFIFLCLLSFILIGVFFYMKADSIAKGETQANKSQSNWTDKDPAASTEKKNEAAYKYVYYTLGIIFIVVAAIFAILICCLRRRIQLAVAIIQSSALFVAENWMALLLPVINFVAMLLWLIFFLLGAIFILSTGEISNKPKHLPFGNFEISSTLKWTFFLYAVGGIWVFCFIVHSAQFILSLATSFWYFERKEKITQFPVLTASKWLYRYHVGTIAFGSGLITILFVVKVVLSIIARQQKASGNVVMEYIAKCCACLVDCFQRFIAWLSKNAYTYCAMAGTGFLSSAWKVFQLILHNPLRFSVTGFLGEIFQVFGELFICLLTGLIGWAIITNADEYKDLHSTITPTIIFVIIGIAVGSLFMTVYGTVADALLIVFVMDEEIMEHHHGGKKPEKVPEPLLEFVNDAEEHNRK